LTTSDVNRPGRLPGAGGAGRPSFVVGPVLPVLESAALRSAPAVGAGV
jgi:hypothetical protein